VKFKIFSIALFCILLFLTACSDSTSVEYNIFAERNETDRIFLRIETDVTDEESLMEIIKDIRRNEKYKQYDSVYLHIVKPGPENYDDDDILEQSIMRARFANTEKGLIQTGLEELGTAAAEYLYDEK